MQEEGKAARTMHLFVVGVTNLPDGMDARFGGLHVDVITTSTDQDRLRTRELTPIQGGASVDDFFAVAVKSYKDKIQLALVDATRDNLVVGSATMPHWDDRVMYGDEVGLRVRLMDANGQPIARDPDTTESSRRRTGAECIIKVRAIWESDLTDGDARVLIWHTGLTLSGPHANTAGDALGLAPPDFPRTLIVNIIGASITGAAEAGMHLWVEITNASTGQRNRTPVNRAPSAFASFEHLFHVRVRSPRDRLVITVHNREPIGGSGEGSDGLAGSFVGASSR